MKKSHRESFISYLKKSSDAQVILTGQTNREFIKRLRKTRGTKDAVADFMEKIALEKNNLCTQEMDRRIKLSLDDGTIVLDVA